MQTINVVPKIENDRFYFDLPANFSETDYRVQIILKKIEHTRKSKKLAKSKLEKVRQFAGIFQNCAYQVSENEWYMQ